MPIYQYKCKDCGVQFERLVKRGAKNPQCPECERKVVRLISTPNLKFVGSGFYCNDYE